MSADCSRDVLGTCWPSRPPWPPAASRRRLLLVPLASALSSKTKLLLVLVLLLLPLCFMHHCKYTVSSKKHSAGASVRMVRMAIRHNVGDSLKDKPAKAAQRA